MRQIPLALLPAEAPTFENFVPGDNAEAVAAVRALLAGESPVRSVYLWGEPGTGRSHLAQALAAAAGPSAVVLTPTQPAEAFRRASLPFGGTVIVDDCDRLDDARQQAVFQLYNHARADASATFLATGGQPPAALTLRDDLRTRLGWGAVLRLKPLSDDDKTQALRNLAASRGIRLPDELLRYLLTHRPRDIRSLLATVSALDAFALEHKRPLTIPMLHELERLQGDAAARC